MFFNICYTGHILLIQDSQAGTLKNLRISDYLWSAQTLLPDWDQAYAEKLMRLFGLESKWKIKTLSKGMQTMLGAVVGLASGASYTFFDEPSSGLDAANRYHFYQEILKQFEATDRTFVISTHIIDELAGRFEDVIILNDNQLLLMQPVEELTSKAYSLRGSRESLMRYSAG